MKCICTFVQKMLGDGCHICQPEAAARYLIDEIEDHSPEDTPSPAELNTMECQGGQ